MGLDAAPSLPSGWLYKWTNYLKGYRKRWFVLENGLFSYYSNANAVSHTCMGTIDLSTVTITSKTSSTSFTLRENHGRSYHLKALNEQDKRRWLRALSAAQVKANKGLESDSCSDDLNSYSPSRRSGARNKLVQSTNTSGWRSFRPFRRRNRQTLSIVSASEESTAVDLITSGVNSTCSSVVQSPRVGPSAEKETYSISGSQPPLANGFRLTDGMTKGVLGLQERSTGSPSIPLTYSPHRRRCTLNSGLISELRVFREFQHHITAVDAAFDEMVIQTNHIIGSLGEMTVSSEGKNDKGTITIPLSSLSDLQSTIDGLTEASQALACQKAMIAWTTSTEWFQRRLATEYDKGLRLERTVEQLAKQHRALEAQFYSSYTSLASNRPVSPLPPILYGSSTSFQRGTARKMHSFSSMDDVFYDAESTLSSPPNRMGGSNDKMLLHPSFASLGSLRNVDESSGSEEDDLVTAAAEEGIFTVPTGRLPTPITARMNGAGEQGKQNEGQDERGDDIATSSAGSVMAPTRQRRTSIPPRPRISLNLWGVLKNCIGKELSRIPLPVNFNEPLSFLQRVTEDLTYSKCLDEAARAGSTDPVGRLAWIAAFSVSSYATTAVRMSKPFNPLLGETYECDRSEDFGWRSFAEQVSHHPPVVSHYCESTRYGWKFWQEFTVNSKFRGKYLSLIPKGGVHLVFKDGQHYTWSKVTITVHNIIVGRLWAEIHGETIIKSHNNKYTCRMRYESHSYFSRDPDRQVSGLIYDPSGTLMYKLNGKWDGQIEGCSVSPDGTPTGPSAVLLIIEPPGPNSESMYNFNQFAIELNEPEEGVAPTDSRFRPDQRLMELGRWDEANAEKERLEVKQRRKRRAWDLYEAGEASLDAECGPPYTPIWFSPTHDTYTNEDCHAFNGTYWAAKAKQDWSKCPDIF